MYDNAIRKSLTFQIQRLHRKECRQWKVLLLRKYLAHPAHWKELQGMSSYSCKPLHQHPPLDEFATMLETLFAGTPETPLQPNHLTEEPWTLQELMGAIEKLKLNKSADPGWSRRCSSTSPPTLQPKFYEYIIICFQVAIFLRAGDGLCSRCWRNIEKQHWSQTFGRLHPYDCSTKFLLT